jgi:glycosyltransferase involved in cell wall biosynthesis
MTHLAGGRARESAWFLERVWPLVRRRHARATLHLVGSPPGPGAGPALGEGVVVHGYVEDLAALHRTMRVAVVPILHSTGIINRIVDALSAGLPVVSAPGPLATVPGLVAGRHALSARTPAEFADAVSRLLSEPHTWSALSAAGRELARAQPSWEESVARVADEVAWCCGRVPAASGTA